VIPGVLLILSGSLWNSFSLRHSKDLFLNPNHKPHHDYQ
jgi:hypothetical protein